MSSPSETQDRADASRRFVENGYITCSYLTAATFGLPVAVFLEYLMAWGAGRQWVNRTEAEISADTLLSRSQQINARRDLRDAGVLSEERRGLPAAQHYRVDWSAALGCMSATPDRDHPVRGHQQDRENERTSSQNQANLNAKNGEQYIGVNQREVSTGSITDDPLPPTGGVGGLPKMVLPVPVEALDEMPDLRDAVVASGRYEIPPRVGRQRVSSVPTTAPPPGRASMPNADHIDPLLSMSYERMIGPETFKQIATDFRGINVELGAVWVRKVLMVFPFGMTRAHLIETFRRGYQVAADAKKRNTDAPGQHQMRNWRKFLQERLIEFAQEVVNGD